MSKENLKKNCREKISRVHICAKPKRLSMKNRITSSTQLDTPSTWVYEGGMNDWLAINC